MRDLVARSLTLIVAALTILMDVGVGLYIPQLGLPVGIFNVLIVFGWMWLLSDSSSFGCPNCNPGNGISIRCADHKGKPINMKKVILALDIFSTAVALASIIFMGLVFYNEAILHHGILFIEPNLYIATGELFTVIAGWIIALALWIRRLTN